MYSCRLFDNRCAGQTQITQSASVAHRFILDRLSPQLIKSVLVDIVRRV